MSRHTDNLERLLKRLQCWMTPDDELVQLVKRELESQTTPALGQHLRHDWSICYRKFLETNARVHDNENSGHSHA
jgi:hypothetical protein